MPIRTVKQHSDRGSIKTLVDNSGDNEPPTTLELRMKELYEYATVIRDDDLKNSVGFIVMNEPGDKAAFPITLFRHREYVKSLNDKLAAEIATTAKEIELCLQPAEEPYQMKRARDIVLDNTIKKTASSDVYVSPTRSFTRVR
jgi:hypothetical protein